MLKLREITCMLAGLGLIMLSSVAAHVLGLGLLQMLIGKIVFLYCGLRPVSVCGESTRAGDVFFIGSQEETFKLFC